MPAWVRDEKIWEKAKKAVGKEGDRYSGDAYWAVVTKVYKNMGGQVGTGAVEEGAFEIPGIGRGRGGKGRGLGPGGGRGCSQPDHTGPAGKELAARLRRMASLIEARSKDVLVETIKMKNQIDDMLRSYSSDIRDELGSIDGVHRRGSPPFVNLRWNRDRNTLDLDFHFTLTGRVDADRIVRDAIRIFADYGLTVSRRDIEVIRDTASNKQPISHGL